VKPIERPKSRYQLALERGAFPLRYGTTPREQAAKYLATVEHRRDLSARVKPILKEADVGIVLKPLYHQFAYAVDRAVRRYAHATLAAQVNYLTEVWVIKGCNKEVLKQVARAMGAQD
jgi:hypothetical protein